MGLVHSLSLQGPSDSDPLWPPLKLFKSLPPLISHLSNQSPLTHSPGIQTN